MPRPIISWRTPSVEVAYICSLAATSLAANYASIVFGSAHAAVSHSKFPIHSDPLFETGCRVVIALCCPMVLELVQDYLFNPSSLQADVLIKTLIVMMFWIPNIANYTLCIKGHAHPVLLASVIQTQFMATAYTIMLLLNFYNCEIFTSKWVHLLFTSSAMLIAMRTLYNFTGRVLFYYLSFPIQSVLIVAGPLYMLYWLYGNWRLIVNVLMLRGDAVEKAAVGSSSGIRLLFYVLLFFIFAVFFVVAGALSVLELSGGRLYIFSQVLLVALLGILPGRLARLEAVCSDVNLENRKSFVQYISHETRGPLQVATMGLELHLQDMIALDPDKRVASALRKGADKEGEGQRLRAALADQLQNVADVAAACSLAQMTLGELLTFDRLQNGTTSSEKTAIPVFPFVAGVVRSFAIQARYKQIDLCYDWTASLDTRYEHMSVLADRTKLTQAVGNLLSNALKFTPKGGKISCTVRLMRNVLATCERDQDASVSTSTGGSRRGSRGSPGSRMTSPAQSIKAASYSGATDMLRAVLEEVVSAESTDANTERSKAEGALGSLVCRIEVQDGGPGISEVNMSRLFGKFVQFDAAKMQQGGGSGLGLWLTRLILEEHGGAIGATSEGVAGRGCLFFADIPVYSLCALDDRGCFLDDAALLRPSSAAQLRNAPSREASVSHEPSLASGSSMSAGQLRMRSVDSNLHLSAASSNLAEGSNKWTDWELQQAAQNEILVQSLLIGLRLSEPKGGAAPSQPPSRSPSASRSRRSLKAKPSSKPSSNASSVRSGSTIVACASQSQCSGSEKVEAGLDELNATAGPSPAASTRTVKRARINVLIVDDMGSNRKVLRRGVRVIDPDIACVECADGEDAVAVMAAALPVRPAPGQQQGAGGPVYFDIVFIDCQMTTLDGPPAVLKMRNDHGYLGLIYGLTADPRCFQDFKEAGANECFEKPMKPDRLLALISAYKESLDSPTSVP